MAEKYDLITWVDREGNTIFVDRKSCKEMRISARGSVSLVLYAGPTKNLDDHCSEQVIPQLQQAAPTLDPKFLGMSKKK